MIKGNKYGAVIGYTKPLQVSYSLEIVTGHIIQQNAFVDYSQRRIYPRASNHGISLNNSVNYSVSYSG
jgi:hypothetical protein